MRRLILRAMIVTCLAGLSGCVAVSAKGNRFGPDTEVVSANGRVFIVNKRCGEAWEVDLARARNCAEMPRQESVE